MRSALMSATARDRFRLLVHQGFGRLEANHLIMTDADLIAPGREQPVGIGVITGLEIRVRFGRPPANFVLSEAQNGPGILGMQVRQSGDPAAPQRDLIGTPLTAVFADAFDHRQGSDDGGEPQSSFSNKSSGLEGRDTPTLACLVDLVGQLARYPRSHGALLSAVQSRVRGDTCLWSDQVQDGWAAHRRLTGAHSFLRRLRDECASD